MSFCPALPEDSDIVNFLRALGIDWPTAPTNWTNEEREEKIQESLENSQYREREMERGRRTSGGGGRKAEEGENDGALRVNLKRVFQEEGLLGYDPSLGTCTGESECYPIVPLITRVPHSSQCSRSIYFTSACMFQKIEAGKIIQELKPYFY